MAFLFPRNPRKFIYGGKYTKDHHSSFVFPATRSPSFVIATCSLSFVIATCSPSFVIATCSPSFVIATMHASHPTKEPRLWSSLPAAATESYIQDSRHRLSLKPLLHLPQGVRRSSTMSPRVWRGCHRGGFLAIGIARFTVTPLVTGDQDTHTHRDTHPLFKIISVHPKV
jgi:hypothetical protein